MRAWVLLTWVPVVGGALLVAVSDAARPFGLTLWGLGIVYQIVLGLIARAGRRTHVYQERPFP
jgi:hypothetical protein